MPRQESSKDLGFKRQHKQSNKQDKSYSFTAKTKRKAELEADTGLAENTMDVNLQRVGKHNAVVDSNTSDEFTDALSLSPS